MQAPGNTPGASTAGSMSSVGASDINGPFELRAGYQDHNASTSAVAATTVGHPPLLMPQFSGCCWPV